MDQHMSWLACLQSNHPELAVQVISALAGDDTRNCINIATKLRRLADTSPKSNESEPMNQSIQWICLQLACDLYRVAYELEGKHAAKSLGAVFGAYDRSDDADY